MGNERCTIANQEIIKVDGERNLLLIRGAVPGAPGGNVIVSPAKKHPQEKK
jgi:large subunit ribosomal protein L3